MRLIRYRETRLQPLWLLGFALAMTSSLGVAYGAAAGGWVGWPTGLVTSLAAAAWWWHGRANVVVDETGFHVGRMFLERAAIGPVQALDRQAFALRISQAARADDCNSLLARSGGGVVVEVVDETDPMRAWVIGSRRPEALATAITELVRA